MSFFPSLQRMAEVLQAEKRDETIAKQVQGICAQMGMNVCSTCIVLTARTALLMDVTDLKAADAAGFLSLCSASTAFFEFLLNPIAGKLSDGWGRKVFLLQAPVVSTIMRSLVCMYPSKVTIAAERVLTGATMTIGGSTTCASSLADTIDDTVELGRAYASMGTSAGLGVMIGPVIGALVVGSTKNARRAYAAAALLSALQIGVSSSFIRESLRPEQRKTVKATDLATAVNPLGVLSLFQYGPVVATLVSVASIQCFCEGKSISDLNTYYTMNDAKFSYSVRSLYTTVFGVVMTLSGIFGRQTIKTLGTRGHTTFQNIMSAIGFVATGSTTIDKVMFGSLFFYVFGMERRATMSSLAVKAAASAGMGKGEFSAAFANLRALAVSLAPLLYAKVYASGLAATPKSPGRPYFVAALIALIAEALHRTLRDKDLEFS